MNEQQKERIFDLLKEIHAVAKDADPNIRWLSLFISENEAYKKYNFFGFRDRYKSSPVDAFRKEEKEKDAADQS